MVQRLAIIGFIVAVVVAAYAFVQQQEAVLQASGAMTEQAQANNERDAAISAAETALSAQAQAETQQATALWQVEQAATAQAQAQASASAAIAQAGLAETAMARGAATSAAQLTAAAETVTAVGTLQAQSTFELATASAQMEADATEEFILLSLLGTATAQVDLAQFAAMAAEEDRAAALSQSRAAQTEVAQLASDLATAQFQLTGLPPAPTAAPTVPPTPVPAEPTATPRTAGDTTLSQNFESDDGTISFAYPADWFAIEFNNGGISMTNDRALLQTQTSTLTAEQVYIDLFTLTSEQLGGVPQGTPVIEVADALVNNIMAQPGSPFDLATPTELSLSNYPGARSDGSNGDNGLVLILLDVGNETYFVAAASTAPDAIETYGPILEAILETLVVMA